MLNKNELSRILMAGVASLFLFSVAACDQDGPAEELGESIDNAAEETGDAIEDATD